MGRFLEGIEREEKEYMIKLLIDRIKKHRNPVKYWRDLGVSIGEKCEIFSSASLGGEPYLVSIGNKVRITSNVVFITHDGGVWVYRNMYPELSDIDLFGRIRIGNNVHIGNNAVIMPGVTIGDNVIIGVGAIVTHDIPSNTIAAGVPARPIESLTEYLDKHKEDFVHTFALSSEEKKRVLKDL